MRRGEWELESADRRAARRLGSDEAGGSDDTRSRWLVNGDEEPKRLKGEETAERIPRVLLHPLTEVGLRMLMAVVVGGGQRVMDLQRRDERHECDQGQNQRAGQEHERGPMLSEARTVHGDGFYQREPDGVKDRDGDRASSVTDHPVTDGNKSPTHEERVKMGLEAEIAS